MAGFATYTDLKTAFDAQHVFHRSFRKSLGSVTNNTWGASWAVGGYPAAMATPATTPGTSHTNTAGGLCFPDKDRKYLYDITARQGASTGGPWSLWLVDRLVSVSGIAMNSTGDKTINSTTLPRYTDGIGVLAFLEVTTAGTTTAPVMSMNSYTDQDGNTGNVGAASLTMPATNSPAGQMIGPFPLAAGDTGIKAISTINLSVAGGGSGVCNLVLVKPIAVLSGNAPGTYQRLGPFPFMDMPRIYDGATLGIMQRSFGGGADIAGTISVVYG